MLDIFKKIFPSKHQRDVEKIKPLVGEINGYYQEYDKLSDDELRQKTVEFKQRIKEYISEIEDAILKKKEDLKEDIPFEEREKIHNEIDQLQKDLDKAIAEILDELLPEAFAVVKDTCRRLYGKIVDVVGNKLLWDMIPYDEQLIGGVVLHQGRISEMATGEGKTLVATMPTYLNALPGRGIHIVTVNDYLAQRDSEWMGKIFEFHGLTVGCILQSMDPQQRRERYNCDITYGTNNEFGFDYLRDNMVVRPEDMVQRGHNYTIVDEVDSVLIDEARTPLIISGPVEVDDHKFNEMKSYVERLYNAQVNLVARITGEAEQLMKQEKFPEAGVLLLRAMRGLPKSKKLAKIFTDSSAKSLTLDTEREYMRDQNARMNEIDDELYFTIDEKSHLIDLTEKGRETIAQTYPGNDKNLFVIPDIGTEYSHIDQDASVSPEEKVAAKEKINALFADRSDRIHTIHQLLKAYCLYEKDVEYVVSDDAKIMIVDEFTGRLLSGRRYSEGLHQAIEAKEGVRVERDTQTLATVTLQNYFRLYKKLAGMTGTAETESAEFFDIYKLDVVVVPTHKTMIREDHDDMIYRTKREKYNAVIAEIEACRTKGQPSLVGTTSVEVSETISRMLKRKGIPHNVLNAKQHQREAEIVAHAGLPGAITIATNMAGRGTDIKLGPGIAEVGGLHIIGTERHEARRIDRQLRGRSGRQGDPGSSRFYLSLEDDLMRLFGSEKISRIMEKWGMQEGEVLKHPIVTRSVGQAQKKVETNNFGIRKRLLEYDNVMNQQREVIYSRRRNALLNERIRDDILEMARDIIQRTIERLLPDGAIEEMKNEIRAKFLFDVPLSLEQFDKLGPEGVTDEVFKLAEKFYKRKEEQLGNEMMGNMEKLVMLQTIDSKWRDHLREMDDLKEGIHLRGYGQKDPLVEYKTEAFKMFMEMMEMLSDEVSSMAFKLYPERIEQLPAQRARRLPPRNLQMTHANADGAGLYGAEESLPPAHQRAGQQSGRPPGVKQTPVVVGEKIGRNDPCPCGSGKKYKACHGKI
jgi:preprotein translocase subunit SecA